MAKHSLDRYAYYLTLIGGVLLVILTLLALIGHAVTMPFQVPLAGMTFGFTFLPLILGIVAIILAKRVAELAWAIVLIVVGFLGGGIGGILVILGGLLGIASKYV